MIKINVIVSDNAWKKNIPKPENYLKKKLTILKKKDIFFKKKKFGVFNFTFEKFRS